MTALLVLILVCSWSGAAAIPADKLHPTSGVRAQSSPTVEREPSTPDPDHTIGHPRARAAARANSPSGARPDHVGSIAAPLIGGKATWYGASGMIGAAGPALRSYLGRHWRGTTVSVCASRCVVVLLSDWCACPRRLIDLSDNAFAQIAPLSKGVIDVTITRSVRIPQPPATDTE